MKRTIQDNGAGADELLQLLGAVVVVCGAVVAPAMG